MPIRLGRKVWTSEESGWTSTTCGRNGAGDETRRRRGVGLRGRDCGQSETRGIGEPDGAGGADLTDLAGGVVGVKRDGVLGVAKGRQHKHQKPRVHHVAQEAWRRLPEVTCGFTHAANNITVMLPVRENCVRGGVPSAARLVLNRWTGAYRHSELDRAPLHAWVRHPAAALH